jgi:hypothetical protein
VILSDELEGVCNYAVVPFPTLVFQQSFGGTEENYERLQSDFRDSRPGTSQIGSKNYDLSITTFWLAYRLLHPNPVYLGKQDETNPWLLKRHNESDLGNGFLRSVTDSWRVRKQLKDQSSYAVHGFHTGNEGS